MKLFVLGGTGATGKLFVERALEKGHHVTALVRDPASVTKKHDNLTLVKGRATVGAELEPTIAGSDAVVVLLGPRDSKDPVCAEVATLLVPAMKKHGVKRLVWLSAGGVGESAVGITKGSWFFGKILMPLFLKHPYANHLIAEGTIRASDLDWTIVRPVQLVDASTGRPIGTCGPDEKPGALKISRDDVAKFFLDESEARAHVRKTPTLFA
jgi:putative NADH-flavin reductase